MRKRLFQLLSRFFAFFNQPEWISVLVFLLGLLNLWSTVFPLPQRRIFFFLGSLFPWLGSASRLFLLFAGLSLIYLSFGLVRRRLTAWLIMELMALGAMAAHFFPTFSLTKVTANFFFALWLFKNRRYFQGKIPPPQGKKSLAVLFFSLFLIVFYGGMVFYFQQQGRYSLKESWWVVTRSLAAFSWQGPSVGNGWRNWFFFSLPFFSSLALFYSFTLLLQTIASARIKKRENWQEGWRLIRRWGRSTADCFKLWPANAYFLFTPRKKALLAFVRLGNNLIALGDPVGPKRFWPKILKKFFDFSFREGKNPLVLGVGETAARMARRLKMKAIYLADEALVNLKADPYQIKDLRNVATKLVKRRQHSFFLWRPPLNEKQLRQLKRVSDRWLESLGRRDTEGVFGSGWIKSMVKHSLVAVVKDGRGRPVAFATLINGFRPRTLEVDLMRRLKEAENGVMEFLFAEVWRWGQKNGFAWLDLGGAPPPGLTLKKFEIKRLIKGKRPLSLPGKLISFSAWRRLPGSLVARLKKIKPEKIKGEMSRLYFNLLGELIGDYQGLRRFKGKFRPLWRRRFLVYRSNLDLLYLLWSWPFLSRKPLTGEPTKEFYYRFLGKRNRRLGREKKTTSF